MDICRTKLIDSRVAQVPHDVQSRRCSSELIHRLGDKSELTIQGQRGSEKMIPPPGYVFGVLPKHKIGFTGRWNHLGIAEVGVAKPYGILVSKAMVNLHVQSVGIARLRIGVDAIEAQHTRFDRPIKVSLNEF